jgi:hypothetical protein
MKMVKSLLLGSAAGLVTIAGASAADLPVKAKPVEYVRVCSLYGEGFWYVPGTDTCIKIGAYVRFQADYNAGNGGQPYGQGDFSDTDAGLGTRTDTSQGTLRYRGVLSIDLRTQTEYGTLRSYMDLGTQATGVGRFGGGASGVSVLGSIPTPTSNANNYFNEATDVSRAFIQFAGITAGRIRSFFDINVLPGLDNSRISNDTAAGGLVGAAYTAQLGNGISASISFEDGGTLISGRGYYVTNASTFSSAAGLGNFGIGAGQGQNDFHILSPVDPILAVRIDQAWGYAQVSGALHPDSAGYYGTSQSGGLATGTNAIGHPADAWGWAVDAGFTLTNFLGFRGDTFGVMGAYGQGAERYVNQSNSNSLLVSGNKLTSVGNIDAIYSTGTGLNLTTDWMIDASWDHVWNANWRTSVFGGITGVQYGATAKSMICPAGSAAGATGLAWSNFVFSPGSTCNPDYSTYQIGTRTLWNPVPMLDIGVEVLYTQLNQSNTGGGTLTTPIGALAPNFYNFASQGIWSGFFRIQRNFLY